VTEPSWAAGTRLRLARQARGPWAVVDLRSGHARYGGFTRGGLRTTVDAQVQRADGAVIPGLYAAGACASHIAQDGKGYSSGTQLGAGSFFGRRKGHTLRAHQADLIENLLPHLALDTAGDVPADISDLVEALKAAPIEHYKAKDMLRASGLALLTPDNPHVAADLAKVHNNKALSPFLRVRGDLTAGVALQFADGYHRVGASYHRDENTDIPCRIADHPGHPPSPPIPATH